MVGNPGISYIHIRDLKIWVLKLHEMPLGWWERSKVLSTSVAPKTTGDVRKARRVGGEGTEVG